MHPIARAAPRLAWMVLLLAILPLAAARPAQATPAMVPPDEFELRIEMLDLDRATVTATQRWSATSAPAFRDSVDVTSGDGDGFLTHDEAIAAADALAFDFRGDALRGLLLDQEPAIVFDAEAEILAPPEGPASLALVLHVRFLPSSGGHLLMIEPAWNATVTLDAPDGWIAERADGQGAGRFEALQGEATPILLLPEPEETVLLTARHEAGAPLLPLALGSAIGAAFLRGRSRKNKPQE